MGETATLQEALARADRGKARLESENAQLRRELKKVRSSLDELLERFQTAVRTARRFVLRTIAGMLFSSSSERQGVLAVAENRPRSGRLAETVESEVELDCPAFIWDDDPTGGLAGGGAADVEAATGDRLPEERRVALPRRRSRPRGRRAAGRSAPPGRKFPRSPATWSRRRLPAHPAAASARRSGPRPRSGCTMSRPTTFGS